MGGREVSNSEPSHVLANRQMMLLGAGDFACTAKNEPERMETNHAPNKWTRVLQEEALSGFSKTPSAIPPCLDDDDDDLCEPQPSSLPMNEDAGEVHRSQPQKKVATQVSLRGNKGPTTPDSKGVDSGYSSRSSTLPQQVTDSTQPNIANQSLGSVNRPLGRSQTTLSTSTTLSRALSWDDPLPSIPDTVPSDIANQICSLFSALNTGTFDFWSDPVSDGESDCSEWGWLDDHVETDESPHLAEVKRTAIDQLLKRFQETYWTTHNDGEANTYTRGSTPSTTQPNSPTVAKKGKKRRRLSKSQDGDQSDGNDEEQHRKRPAEPKSKDQSVPKYPACPFYKKDPANHPDCQWRPIRQIRHLKGHLKKYHRRYPCQRCKKEFKSQSEVEAHAESETTCIANTHTPEYSQQGWNWLMDNRIPQQKTSTEQWQIVYSNLFPDAAPVPSPYLGVEQAEVVRAFLGFARTYFPGIVLQTLTSHGIPSSIRTTDGHEVALEPLARDCVRQFSEYISRALMPGGVSNLPSLTTDAGSVESQMPGPGSPSIEAAQQTSEPFAVAHDDGPGTPGPADNCLDSAEHHNETGVLENNLGLEKSADAAHSVDMGSQTFDSLSLEYDATWPGFFDFEKR